MRVVYWKSENECLRLQGIAISNSRVLMDAIKTAYATAYARLLLLAKSGRIEGVVSVDAVCSSLTKPEYVEKTRGNGSVGTNSLFAYRSVAWI